MTYHEEPFMMSNSPNHLRNNNHRRRKRRRSRGQKLFAFTVFLVVTLVFGGLIFFSDHGDQPSASVNGSASSVPDPSPTPVVDPTPPDPEPAEIWTMTENTKTVEDSFPSEYVILTDLDTGEIIAQKNADARINPASMTKILTLLVAVENIPDTSGTYTMNFDISDYCYVNKCSVVGYLVDEVIPVSELFYGCILNSGADACLALADVAAGSHENFVVLMNKKLEELGLSDTAHFTNCVGLYDEEHYCTVGDIATILKAALENEKAREVLSTRVFTISATNKHASPQDMSNWFIRRIEDYDTGVVDVLYAKTGYVSQSGFCAASGGVTEDGKTYLCVTGKSTSTKQSTYDHAALYRQYIKSQEVPEASA